MATLTMEQALGAIRAAVGKAREIESPSSIAIVDGGRELVAFARMDGALLASIEISQGKAYTARSMNMNTADIGPLTQPGQPLYGIETSHARPLITFGGGQLLSVDGEIVGAVGVAGGTVVQDDEVASAAVASLG
ncbi:MAG: heme-binding protein [Actinobacteria bacterium]|nr:heme-binding protein [Actinomycetota bacterium]